MLSAYEFDTTHVYWLVDAGTRTRHATGTRPGALPGGEWIPAICETWMRAPFATPLGLEPRAQPTTRCPQCTQIVIDNDYVAITWDP